MDGLAEHEAALPFALAVNLLVGSMVKAGLETDDIIISISARGKGTFTIETVAHLRRINAWLSWQTYPLTEIMLDSSLTMT
jgi:hypothetical protein